MREWEGKNQNRRLERRGTRSASCKPVCYFTISELTKSPKGLFAGGRTDNGRRTLDMTGSKRDSVQTTEYKRVRIKSSLSDF